MVDKYDVYIQNEFHVTFYNNNAVRLFVEGILNKNNSLKKEDIRVLKNGQPLTIDVYHEVSIGGQ